jgi:TPP-dependent pyruvate/acetoin dehydrogenase alpha subunit
MKIFKHENLIKIFKKNKIIIKNRSIALKLFKFISYLRLIEQSLEKNYHPFDKMKCPVHFCHGQECVPAALHLLLKKDDYLFSHHRSHGYYLAKNCPPNKLFAELYGKITGANGGIAGSQDISYPKENFFSGAILAGATAIAVGTATAIKINKKRNIVVSGFGESATDQGVFWESLNYSALHSLPILFVCENNNFSVFTPQKQRQSGDSIAKKTQVFGIKAEQVFGNDPLKVYEKLKKAIIYIKKFKKPFLLEAFTFRTISHVGPLSDDPSNLIETKDYKFWIKNSPYEIMKKKLLKSNLLTQKKIIIFEQKIKKEISKYFEFADKSKFPLIKNFLEKNYDLNLNKNLKKIKVLSSSKLKFDQEIKQAKGY